MAIFNSYVKLPEGTLVSDSAYVPNGKSTRTNRKGTMFYFGGALFGHIQENVYVDIMYISYVGIGRQF